MNQPACSSTCGFGRVTGARHHPFNRFNGFAVMSD